MSSFLTSKCRGSCIVMAMLNHWSNFILLQPAQLCVKRRFAVKHACASSYTAHRCITNHGQHYTCHHLRFHNLYFLLAQPIQLIHKTINPPVCGLDLPLHHLLLLRRARTAFVQFEHALHERDQLIMPRFVGLMLQL